MGSCQSFLTLPYGLTGMRWQLAAQRCEQSSTFRQNRALCRRRVRATVEEVVELMHRREKRDLSLETTTSGPHRDRFVLMHPGGEFAHVASTGQIRLCSLILRVAQANFYSGKTGKQPVLLLDDVLLELDSSKRERFIRELPSFEQAFFTFLPDEPFRRYSGVDTLIYRVVDGEFEREKSG